MKRIIALFLLLSFTLIGCTGGAESKATNVADGLEQSSDMLSKCETAGGMCLPNCEVEYKTEYSHYLCLDASNKATGKKCCF